MKTPRELLETALDLPPKERAVLALELFASLEEPAKDPALVQRAWGEEIERRWREIVEGRVKTVPFDEAIAQARAAVAQVRAKRRA